MIHIPLSRETNRPYQHDNISQGDPIKAQEFKLSNHKYSRCPLILAPVYPGKYPLSRHYFQKTSAGIRGPTLKVFGPLCSKFCNFTTTKKLVQLPGIIPNFGLRMDTHDCKNISIVFVRGKTWCFNFSGSVVRLQQSDCLNTDNFAPTPHRKAFREPSGQQRPEENFCFVKIGLHKK